MKNFRKLGVLIGLFMILSIVSACGSSVVTEHKTTKCYNCQQIKDCYKATFVRKSDNKEESCWYCSKECDDLSSNRIIRSGYIRK